MVLMDARGKPRWKGDALFRDLSSKRARTPPLIAGALGRRTSSELEGGTGKLAHATPMLLRPQSAQQRGRVGCQGNLLEAGADCGRSSANAVSPRRKTGCRYLARSGHRAFARFYDIATSDERKS